MHFSRARNDHSEDWVAYRFYDRIIGVWFKRGYIFLTLKNPERLCSLPSLPPYTNLFVWNFEISDVLLLKLLKDTQLHTQIFIHHLIILHFVCGCVCVCVCVCVLVYGFNLHYLSQGPIKISGIKTLYFILSSFVK